VVKEADILNISVFLTGAAMDRLATIDKDELVRQMRAEFEATMERVAKAVNAAPDGHLIDGSDGACREALMEFMRLSYEKAVQMRVDATEQSVAFSPCAPPKSR